MVNIFWKTLAKPYITTFHSWSCATKNIRLTNNIVDISNCPEIQKGDEVVSIGKQGNLAISVDSFGDLSSQLNYELLTCLPEEIPRRIIK